MEPDYHPAWRTHPARWIKRRLPAKLFRVISFVLASDILRLLLLFFWVDPAIDSATRFKLIPKARSDFLLFCMNFVEDSNLNRLAGSLIIIIVINIIIIINNMI